MPGALTFLEGSKENPSANTKIYVLEGSRTNPSSGAAVPGAVTTWKGWMGWMSTLPHKDEMLVKATIGQGILREDW